MDSSCGRGTYCIQFVGPQPKYCVHFWIDGPRIKAYVPAMKPLIPSDATSKVLGTEADSGRDDQSLHDEILTRLRDHIVEGNIPDGDRMPERQLCEMLGISRTPLREALKVSPGASPAKTSPTPRSPKSSGCITRCTVFTCTATCTAISASIS